MENCYSRQFWAQRTIINRAAACAGSLPGLRTIARPQYPPPPIFPPPIPPPDVDWWDVSDEFSCDVIFAYDSNAASYTASKVNLAHPGTYNLTTGGVPVPQWNAERWLFIEQPFGANQAVFLTGYTRPELQYNWTFAFRARDVSCHYCLSEDCQATTVFVNASYWTIVVTCFRSCIETPPTTVGWMNFGDAGFPFIPMPTSESWHVYVVAGETLYIDGVPVGSATVNPGSYDPSPQYSSVFQVGGMWDASSPNNATGGSNEISKVIALDCILTYDQVQVLTERMGAVVADPVLSVDTAYFAITPIAADLIAEESPTGWWLPTGISNADCLWAYKAFGAGSYAASKVNVNNPGTGDLEESGVGVPSWSGAGGWVWPAGGASPLLAPTVTNDGSAITVVIYGQQPGIGEALGGSIYKNLSEVQIAPCVFILPQPSPGGGARFCNGGSTYDNIAYAIGYMSPMGVAGNKAYIDGYDAGITLDAWSGSQTGKFGIGGLCTHHQYMADNVVGNIATVRRILGAVAYKVILTADQMLELNDNFVAWGY